MTTINKISGLTAATALDYTEQVAIVQSGASKSAPISLLRAGLQASATGLDDIAGIAPSDGIIIVGDGTNWTAESGATARASLGLGTLSTQAADSVAITGGTVSGITDLAIADGGTGASTEGAARANLGLGALAVEDTINAAGLVDNGIITEAKLSADVQTKLNYSAPSNLTATSDPTANDDSANTGGNGTYAVGSLWINTSSNEAYRCVDDTATAAVWVNTTLSTDELGTMATQNANSVNITGGTIGGITDLAVADGGTGASTAAGARTNLGALGDVVDDTTPQLGGDLDGDGNSVINSPVSINTQTGTTYTLVAGDTSKVVTCDNASAITLTVPPNSSVAFATGTTISVIQKGAGTVTIAAGAGVTVNNRNSHTDTAGQWAMITLLKIGTDSWVMQGDTA